MYYMPVVGDDLKVSESLFELNLNESSTQSKNQGNMDEVKLQKLYRKAFKWGYSTYLCPFRSSALQGRKNADEKPSVSNKMLLHVLSMKDTAFKCDKLQVTLYLFIFMFLFDEGHTLEALDFASYIASRLTFYNFICIIFYTYSSHLCPCIFPLKGQIIQKRF